MQKTYRITISGQVQGVGFRPYVYGMALAFGLKGTVSNNEKGVIIFASGVKEDIFSFYRKLTQFPPKVSKIDKHSIEQIDFLDYSDFQIIPSEKSARLNLQLTPDFAICEDCKAEVSDKENRRYGYPFTTCVNCGPRWAITDTFPFERAHTSISKFKMCDACHAEYTDPLDRRFHSQTNSCAKCGIALRLVSSEGNLVSKENSEIFKRVSELLVRGNIVAVKNTAGYLLCCNATKAEVIEKLRIKKRRPTKPFAILYPSLELLKKELEVSSETEEILTSSEGPIVILERANYSGRLALDELAPGLNQLGVMLPYTALLQLLAQELTMPIVATSGNIHGSPILSSEEEAMAELSGVADYFLHHDLEILNPQDDSVVKLSKTSQQKVFFRRSRGYAPNYYGNINSTNKIMAMGAHLKSTVAFIPNDYLYLSEYLGNLDNFDVYNRFVRTSTNFLDLFEQQPEIILADAHPAYHSTIYGNELAKKLGIPIQKIQHHKAHFTSVLAEHGLFENEHAVLGVIWDGTGYGEDGQIWGGEFFSYKANQIDRISQLEYYDWLSGDKMAREPRLSLFSLADDDLLPEIETRFSPKELTVLKKMKSKNPLKTSSAGRLFDAVASLLDICHINTYEGEAAILLENSVTSYDIDQCTVYGSITETGTIDLRALIRAIHSETKKGIDKELIIVNFLYTLASYIIDMANYCKLKDIACSGGVFQNTVLVDMLQEKAGSEYRLYFNRNLSPNDENISFGQIMYYLHIKDE